MLEESKYNIQNILYTDKNRMFNTYDKNRTYNPVLNFLNFLSSQVLLSYKPLSSINKSCVHMSLSTDLLGFLKSSFELAFEGTE